MTRALTLEELDRDLYRSPADVLWTPPAGRSVFGGQIAAAALRAATLSLDDAHAGFSISSLHSYFLLGGDHNRPIVYRVTRLRDGRSFSTRSVTATQGGQAIFAAEVQFHREEGTPDSLEHQVDFPAGVPPPESLPSMQENLKAYLADPRLRKEMVPFVTKYIQAPFPMDIRPLSPVDPFGPVPVPSARQLVWMRCTEALGPAETGKRVGAESFLHTAAITYASDWSLASTMMLPHGLAYGAVASPYAVAGEGGGVGQRPPAQPS